MDPSSVFFLLLLVIAVFIAFFFVLILLLGLTYLLLTVRETVFGAAPTYKSAILSRRNVLLFVAACFFFDDPSCPTEFSCPYQHKTTVFTRYAFEVFVGTACTLIGCIGLWSSNPPWIRVLGYYMAAYAVLQGVILLADLLYTQVCGAYPANVLSIMPMLEHAKGGRLRLMVERA